METKKERAWFPPPYIESPLAKKGRQKIKDAILAKPPTPKQIDIELLPKQKQFLQCTEDILIFMAGLGSGKTRIACYWALIRAKMNRTVIMVEPTLDMVKRNLWKTFFEDVFTQLGYREGIHFTLNRSEKVMRFTGGGSIYFVSAEAIESVLGLNAHDAIIDEYASIKDSDVYDKITGRLRQGTDNQLRLVGTPKPLPWIKDLVDNKKVPLIRQATFENYFLKQKYIDNLKLLYGEDSPWYRQEVLGEICDFAAGLIETDKIKIVRAYPTVRNLVRAWDFAHTDKKTSDYTANVLMGDNVTDTIIYDVQRWKGEYGAVRERIIQTMLRDPSGTRQIIENSQGGMVIRSDLMRDPRLRNIAIFPVNATTDKITRALPFASRVVQGLVTLVDGPYVKDYLNELGMFGDGKGHDDQVDATTHAYAGLQKDQKIMLGNIGVH